MYIPAHFQMREPAAIAGFIAAHPLAQLVAHSPEGLITNPLPLLATSDTVLIGHMALANDMHRIVPDGADVLAIFQGDDAYVSPDWYPSKGVDHKVVPTWNYSCVQVHGMITFQHDEKAKIGAVGRLTQRHEKTVNGGQAWKMADAPKDYMAQMLAGIVAFRIDVTRVLAKSKLSQNKAAADIAGVAQKLRERGADEIAGRMLGEKRDITN